MKRIEKPVLLLLLTALLLGAVAGCARDPQGPSGETGQNPVPTGTHTGAQMLTDMTLDGGYSLQFDPAVTDYEVHLPAGRPRIPKVTAQAAEGCTASVTQAVIPDTASSGMATVSVADGEGNTATYCVRFVQDAELGFHLQYGDFYPLDVDPAQVSSWESSDEKVLYVYHTGPFAGQVRAESCSEAPVTVRALAADGTVLASLTVDRVVKAPLNIFLITGQSNAAGTYDIPAGMSAAEFTASQLETVLKPAPGTVLCTDVSMTGSILEDMYDLSVGRAGFSPALGKTWYDLTGEKTLMIQTAVGGAPIEAWMKPEAGVRNTYGSLASNFYETTYNAFRHCLEQINAADSGYELNRVHAYWLQGETGMASTYDPDRLGPGIGDWVFGSREHILSAQEYYDIFLRNMAYFEEDFGCEFMGILLVRALQEVCDADSIQQQLLTDLVPARAAQYALHNATGRNIAIVSRVCDMARMTSWEDRADPGWGLMGSGNLHYNQAGHNLNGVQAAQNTFNLFYSGEAGAACDIEILAANGRDRLEDGAVLQLAAGQTTQLAAMVLPMYTSTPNISWEVADPSLLHVDRFGCLTAARDGAGETTLTVRCEAAGLCKSIRVRVGRKTADTVSYEWNFDRGDLTEKNGRNNLTLSEKTGGNGSYAIRDGIYTSANNLTNFAMETPVRISSEYDWQIEWRAMLQTNSALLGTAGNWTNFLYLAYSVPFEVANPCRIVGADGTALMIPYGQYAECNTGAMHTWKLEYRKQTGRVSLFMDETQEVGSVEMPDGWYAEFTNLFGSYTTEVNVDFWGSVDYVRISTTQETVRYD